MGKFPRRSLYGKNESMYVIIDDPDEVDNLGTPMREKLRIPVEGPPMPDHLGLKQVNSIGTRRVLLDNNTKVMYKQEETGT